MAHGAGCCFNSRLNSGIVVGGCFAGKSSVRRCSSFSTIANTISMDTSSTRIAVVGDVHNDWDLELDSAALNFLQAPSCCDRSSSICDFGNQNVDLVDSIARLDLPKAAILGNHDVWYTHRFSKKGKDAVQLQLESFGDEHVGYKRLDFPIIKLSVVGGRPFSSGGNQLFRANLLSARYGVADMAGSVKRIYRAAVGAPADHLLIFLAHNGPAGLGSNVDDICGRDWKSGGGDHGDPDLAEAISQVKATAKRSVPLVVFGHMHKELARGAGLRKMISIESDNTIYLNGAVVPRVKMLKDDDQAATSTSNSRARTARAFTVVEFSGGRVTKIAETWVSVAGEGKLVSLQEEHVLFSSNHER